MRFYFFFCACYSFREFIFLEQLIGVLYLKAHQFFLARKENCYIFDRFQESIGLFGFYFKNR